MEVYEDVFLGSAGQKVTAEKIAPDDFPLYYPKYETDMDVFIQQSSDKKPYVDERGDFALQYDMYYLEIFAPILESDISTKAYQWTDNPSVCFHPYLYSPFGVTIGKRYTF